MSGRNRVFAEMKARIMKKFPGAFDKPGELRVMKGPPMKITLKEGAIPYKCPTARAIALHQSAEAERELQKYLDSGVIEKVSHPTDWISPAFFVKKPHGGVRLVTDYTK